MNTNVQTIHQMGLGINAMVKQATGRESVSGIEHDWVSVEQLARYIYGSESGDIVSFDTNITDGIVSLIAYITAVQDLHGYDNPWPGGGGDNLVNPADFVASSTDVTVTITGNEVSAVGNGEGPFLNARILMSKRTYPAGTYYVKFKVKTGATINADTKMCLRNSNGVVKASTSIISDTLEYSVTWTIEENCYLTLLLNGNTTGEEYATDITVYDVIVSTTDAAFSPYSNICPITGWTGCNVEHIGKNFLDTSSFTSGTYNTIILTRNTDGTISLSGTASSTVNMDSSIFTLPAGTYTLSGSIQNNQLYIRDAVTYETLVESVNGVTRSFTNQKTRTVRLRLRIGNGSTVDGTVKPQLELGPSASDYEEYQGEVYAFTFPDEAGTVYGGTLDVLSGVLTVTHKYISVADVATINSYGTGAAKYYYFTVTDVKKAASTSATPDMISNQYAAITPAQATGSGDYKGISAGVNVSQIFIKDTSVADVTALKAQGITIVYELAEPVTYQLTAQEVTALIGENTIFADTGDVSVQYKVKEDLL